MAIDPRYGLRSRSRQTLDRYGEGIRTATPLSEAEAFDREYSKGEKDLQRGLRQFLAQRQAGIYANEADRAEQRGSLAEAERLRTDAATQQYEAAAYNTPQINEIKGETALETVGNAVDWGQSLAGQLIPYAGTSAGAAYIANTALSVTPLGRGIRAGLSTLAGALSSYPANRDLLSGDQLSDPELMANTTPEERLQEASRTGLKQAALELGGPLAGTRIASRTAGALARTDTARRRAQRSVTSRVAQDVLTEAPLEGFTEVAQTLLEQRSMDRLNPNRDRSHDKQALTESLIAGIVGGALFGGVSSAPSLVGAAARAPVNIGKDVVGAARQLGGKERRGVDTSRPDFVKDNPFDARVRRESFYGDQARDPNNLDEFDPYLDEFDPISELEQEPIGGTQLDPFAAEAEAADAARVENRELARGARRDRLRNFGTREETLGLEPEFRTMANINGYVNELVDTGFITQEQADALMADGVMRTADYLRENQANANEIGKHIIDLLARREKNQGTSKVLNEGEKSLLKELVQKDKNGAYQIKEDVSSEQMLEALDQIESYQLTNPRAEGALGSTLVPEEQTLALYFNQFRKTLDLSREEVKKKNRARLIKVRFPDSNKEYQFDLKDIENTAGPVLETQIENKGDGVLQVLAELYSQKATFSVPTEASIRNPKQNLEWEALARDDTGVQLVMDRFLAGKSKAAPTILQPEASVDQQRRDAQLEGSEAAVQAARLEEERTAVPTDSQGGAVGPDVVLRQRNPVDQSILERRIVAEDSQGNPVYGDFRNDERIPDNVQTQWINESDGRLWERTNDGKLLINGVEERRPTPAMKRAMLSGKSARGIKLRPLYDRKGQKTNLETMFDRGLEETVTRPERIKKAARKARSPYAARQRRLAEETKTRRKLKAKLKERERLHEGTKYKVLRRHSALPKDLTKVSAKRGVAAHLPLQQRYNRIMMEQEFIAAELRRTVGAPGLLKMRQTVDGHAQFLSIMKKLDTGKEITDAEAAFVNTVTKTVTDRLAAQGKKASYKDFVAEAAKYDAMDFHPDLADNPRAQMLYKHYVELGRHAKSLEQYSTALDKEIEALVSKHANKTKTAKKYRQFSETAAQSRRRADKAYTEQYRRLEAMHKALLNNEGFGGFTFQDWINALQQTRSQLQFGESVSAEQLKRISDEFNVLRPAFDALPKHRTGQRTTRYTLANFGGSKLSQREMRQVQQIVKRLEEGNYIARTSDQKADRIVTESIQNVETFTAKNVTPEAIALVKEVLGYNVTKDMKDGQIRQMAKSVLTTFGQDLDLTSDFIITVGSPNQAIQNIADLKGIPLINIRDKKSLSQLLDIINGKDIDSAPIIDPETVSIAANAIKMENRAKSRAINDFLTDFQNELIENDAQNTEGFPSNETRTFVINGEEVFFSPDVARQTGEQSQSQTQTATQRTVARRNKRVDEHVRRTLANWRASERKDPIQRVMPESVTAINKGDKTAFTQKSKPKVQVGDRILIADTAAGLTQSGRAARGLPANPKKLRQSERWRGEDALNQPTRQRGRVSTDTRVPAGFVEVTVTKISQVDTQVGHRNRDAAYWGRLEGLDAETAQKEFGKHIGDWQVEFVPTSYLEGLAETEVGSPTYNADSAFREVLEQDLGRHLRMLRARRMYQKHGRLPKAEELKKTEPFAETPQQLAIPLEQAIPKQKGDQLELLPFTQASPLPEEAQKIPYTNQLQYKAIQVVMNMDFDVESQGRLFKSLFGNPKNQRVNKKLKRKITRMIHAMLGPDVQIEMDQTMEELGAAGTFRVDSDTGAYIIQLAIEGADPYSNGFHEAMHGLAAALSESPEGRALYNIMKQATSSPKLMRQLNEILQHHSEARKAARTDPHERIAYMFQFWMTGELQTTPKQQNFFQRFGSFMYRIMGRISQEQQAETIFQAFADGKLARHNKEEHAALYQQLAKLEQGNKITALANFMDPAVTTVFKSPITRLRAHGHPVLDKLTLKWFAFPEDEANAPLGMLQRRQMKMNQYMNKWFDITKTIPASQMEGILHNLQSMKQGGKHEAVIRELLSEMFAYMQDAGVEVQLWNGSEWEWKPLSEITEQEFYFPRVWDTKSILENESQFRAMMLKHGAGQVMMTTEGKHVIMNNSYLDSFIAELKKGNDMQDMVNLAYHNPANKAINPRVFTFIDPSNAADFAEFQSQDALEIMSTHIFQAVHRAEHSRTMGGRSQLLERDLLAVQNDLTDAQYKDVLTSIQALEGTLGSDTWGQRYRNHFGLATTLANFAKLPLALFASLVDPLILWVRTGEFSAALNAYRRGLQEMWRGIRKAEPTEQRALAELLGVIEANVGLELVGSYYNSPFMNSTLHRANEKFFRWIGLNAWTRGMRVAAMESGLSYLKKYATDTKRLQELNLSPDDIKIVNDRVALSTNEGLTAEQETRMQEAMFRFVDSAVLRPNSAKRPAWMSDPRWTLFAHLKQFTFDFHHTVHKRVWKNIKESVAAGETTGSAALGILQATAPLAAFVPVMMAADLARKAISGRLDDEDDDWGELVSDGIRRSAIAGTGTFLLDAAQDVEHSGNPFNSAMGPVPASALGVTSAMFSPDRKLSSELLKLLPGYAFWAGYTR